MYLRCLLACAVLIALGGCNSSGPGDPISSGAYDASRDEVFDAMRFAIDAYYDLDDVNRDRGTITTHWDMSHAAGVFSQQGWRARAFGKIREDRQARREGREAYYAEIKVALETNLDKDAPMHPSTSKEWRKEGNNPALAKRIIAYMDTLLRDQGPSDIWRRQHASDLPLRDTREP